MLAAIRDFFRTHVLDEAGRGDPAGTEHALRLATAALLVEMTRADHAISAAERAAVEEAVRRVFGLTAEETGELVRLAEQEASEATSLYPFTSLINRHLSHDQKDRVVELLWEVAYADGGLDSHEEHLVRKVAGLIHVPHQAFIRAKLRAQERR
jgi:uncharacterized tellurite resistance protein B-like protein